MTALHFEFPPRLTRARGSGPGWRIRGRYAALCQKWLKRAKSGPCGLVMVDNTGNWNASRKASIIERCRKLAASDGMQFLLGEATEDGALRIVDASVSA